MSENVTRSTVNNSQYAAPEFPKSGFDLSYKRYASYILGRLHVSGYQDVMPSDKFSGKNDGNFTFNTIKTPMVAPVDVMQYNLFLPFRAIDRTFERAFAPSKNNGMSSSWSAPTFKLRDIVSFIISNLLTDADGDDWFGTLLQMPADGIATDANDILYTLSTGIANLVPSILLGQNNDFDLIYNDFKKHYLDDALIDIKDYVFSLLGDSDHRISLSGLTYGDLKYLVLDAIFTPFVGRYSYLAELGYRYLRPADLRALADATYTKNALSEFISSIDNTPQNEYALRAMYAIWYEHFRNVDLEPVNNDLPYWRDFGSTSVVYASNHAYLPFLVYRIRNWQRDMFTSAQIDDMSRHVYAPVIASALTTPSKYHVSGFNDLYANPDNDYEVPSKPAQYSLSWLDNMTGLTRTVECPVPANINDVLSANDLDERDIYGLDLNTLRQSQMLERYLKRNYLFGDEYQDRMLAHYNSRVSDLRINRPLILSRSLNGADMDQEIANMSNDVTIAGTRTATATIKANGDQFTNFAEEFGIVINLICFIPQAAYDGISPQRLLTKVDHYPLPEFASNNEEFGRRCEIADTGRDASAFIEDADTRFMFGRYPAYHAWRSRVDSVGGLFLNELQDCTFRRFWGFSATSVLNVNSESPKLNYQFLHCRPNLQMFVDSVRYNNQIYGDVVHEFYVERVLPTPVEVI